MAPTLKKLRWMQKYLVERHEIAFFFYQQMKSNTGNCKWFNLI